MEKYKTKFTQNTIQVIYNLSKVLFNTGNEAEFKNVIGLDRIELAQKIDQILIALPDYVFDFPIHQLKEIEDICAREFIFFQIQEKANEKEYERHFENFIWTLSRDIKKRFPFSKATKVQSNEG